MSNNLDIMFIIIVYHYYGRPIQKIWPYLSYAIDSRLAGWRWSMVSHSRRDCSFIWDRNIYPTHTYLSTFMKDPSKTLTYLNLTNAIEKLRSV